MKAKIKKGKEFLFSEGYSNKWDKLENEMIINFADKYTYKCFKQKENHLLIQVTCGEIDIVFIGETPKLEFNNFCKDQLVLKITK